jgi:WD40 repeat protein
MLYLYIYIYICIYVISISLLSGLLFFCLRFFFVRDKRTPLWISPSQIRKRQLSSLQVTYSSMPPGTKISAACRLVLKYLVGPGDDKVIKMWSIMSGQVSHRFYYSVYLLYWYKSTNSDTWGAASLATCALSRFTTQFNCCTCTKVRILTLTRLHSFVGHTRPVTSISVLVAFGTYVLVSGSLDCTVRVLNLLALLVQKYKYWRCCSLDGTAKVSAHSLLAWLVQKYSVYLLY